MEPSAAHQHQTDEGEEGRVTTSTEDRATTDRGSPHTNRRLTAADIQALDPYQLMAELGKTVIHPGGGRSTRELLGMARIQPHHRVLDAGCGIGTTAAQIAERYGCRVVAVDIKDANCARARLTIARSGVGDRVEIRRGDIERLDFGDEEFDVVIVEAVTMFVHRKRAAAEVVRVCRRDGRVIDHEFIWRKPPPAGARELFMGKVCPGIDFDTEADWTALYAEAGLTDLQSRTGPFAMMTPAGFLRDERPAGTARFIARSVSRTAYVRKMAWLMPRMLRAMPYLGYVVVGGTRP
jgi:ubiquinone/menaquinone biosynthesis C-methylase UbiE